MSERRKFSIKFKRGAVEQTRQLFVSCAQEARELGIGANMLTGWRREDGAAGAHAFGGLRTARDEETAFLERELSRIK